MPSWFRAGKSEDSPAEEALIRVCLVSRDPALIEEVHKALLVGFSTRAGYEFESDHPDFQQYCDVLFVDLRAAGLQRNPGSPTRAGIACDGVEGPGSPTRAGFACVGVGDAQEGLAFIDAIRKSGSHPPIVALFDADAEGFGRELMQRASYDTLTAPLNMPRLRLTLQRAYEFRSAEAKLENFLSEQTAAREGLRSVPRRSACLVSPAVNAPRSVRRASPHVAPSRLAIGLVLGCVLFFAGLVAVRTILSGMGDALASSGSATDSGATAPSVDAIASEARPGGFARRRISPLTSPADFSEAFSADSVPRSSLPGYEPAELIERVTPRYSLEARARHVQGTVRIRAVIGRDGVPRGFARASGDSMLAQIAMDSIALWRYAPATLDGHPIESEVIIPVDFQLPD